MNPGPSVFGLLSDSDWIIQRLAQEIAARVPGFSFGEALRGDPDIVYYLTYSARRQPRAGREIALFTHAEQDPAALQRFMRTARDVDRCVTMAPRYEALLRENGVTAVETIRPGVDFGEFFPRLRVGVVGRTYHTGRKGEGVIAELMDMQDVEFLFTGDGWPGAPLHIPEGRMGEFYRSLDCVLVVSQYEGGPMCVPEAIACGIPVISTDVGWVSDFPHVPVEKNDSASVRRALSDLVAGKKRLAAAAQRQTWDAWAEAHDRLFRRLHGDRPSAPRMPATGPAKVVQVLHGPERTSQGGPTLRVPETARRLGSVVPVSEHVYGAGALPDGTDIAHLYNIWHPNSAAATMAELRRRARKVVFSPILLDLTLHDFWANRLPGIVAAAASSPTAFAASLPRLTEAYEAAAAQRPVLLSGYDPAPGYIARLRATVAQADHLVFLSDRERILAEGYCGALGPHSVVFNPVDADVFSRDLPHTPPVAERLRREFDLDPEAPFLLSVGRVEARKNQLAMAEIARRTGIPLLIAGHVGSKAYADLVRRVGGGRVVLLGRVAPGSDDLIWLMRGCTAFLSLSWAEGASLSALEAAAAGAPLLLSDCSSEREYFADLAEFAGPLDVDGAVARLDVLGRIDRKAYRRRAREIVGRRCSWDGHVSALKQIYAAMSGSAA